MQKIPQPSTYKKKASMSTGLIKMSCSRPLSHRRSLLVQVLPMAFLVREIESGSQRPLAALTKPARPLKAGDSSVVSILVSGKMRLYSSI